MTESATKKFALPEAFSKELAPTSIKIYTRKLNALAVEGFTTVDDLLTKKLQVIRAIKKLVPGDEMGPRMTRRQYLSAIFWVCPTLKGKKNTYYTYYQKNLPLVDGWEKRTDYKPAE